MRDVVVHPAELLGATSGSRKWWTLAAVCLTTFMLLLDLTIVSVALPTISRELHPSFANLQWIVDAYSLMLAAVLLTAGSLADIFGRRRVIVIGQVVFLIGSVLCALATSATMLDLTRGLQGVGGAMMFACALALIVQEFPAHERGIAFGVYGAVNSLSWRSVRSWEPSSLRRSAGRRSSSSTFPWGSSRSTSCCARSSTSPVPRPRSTGAGWSRSHSASC